MMCKRASVLLLPLLTVSPIQLSAQQQRTTARSRADWACVQEIPANQKIRVHLQNGKLLKGSFLRADPEVLTLLTGGKEEKRVGKGEILSIGTKSRARGGMLGALIGGGLGAGIGAGAGCPDCNKATGGDRMKGAALFGGLFGAIGAGTGAVTGSERSVCEFQAQKSQPAGTQHASSGPGSGPSSRGTPLPGRQPEIRGSGDPAELAP